jgi:hypothetical protein
MYSKASAMEKMEKAPAEANANAKAKANPKTKATPKTDPLKTPKPSEGIGPALLQAACPLVQ